MTLREAFERRDLDAFLALLDPDVVWQGVEPDQICRNREEVRQTIEAIQASGRSGRPEVVAETGDALVVDPHAEPPVPGLEELHHVYTLRDGRVARMQDYPDRASALKAVGLA